ncbi:putative paxneb protein superfamily [Rosellinia necatrix]|uniref:Putative paxneb protein superfamily n=1 Tax=Rosellinia necatrix TaxID=77044 RepID=A0A1W2TWZ2_ROSNE|nr:putative paxneb protein superfamily [Rosellinia necatrix]
MLYARELARRYPKLLIFSLRPSAIETSLVKSPKFSDLALRLRLDEEQDNLARGEKVCQQALRVHRLGAGETGAMSNGDSRRCQQ